MEKVLYIVACYIPEDENVVQSNIFKLQCIGQKNKRYGFISIENSGGIGTSCDDWGEETAEDAIINSTNYIQHERFKFIKTSNFDKVLEIRASIIAGLQKELNEKI